MSIVSENLKAPRGYPASHHPLGIAGQAYQEIAIADVLQALILQSVRLSAERPVFIGPMSLRGYCPHDHEVLYCVIAGYFPHEGRTLSAHALRQAIRTLVLRSVEPREYAQDIAQFICAGRDRGLNRWPVMKSRAGIVRLSHHTACERCSGRGTTIEYRIADGSILKNDLLEALERHCQLNPITETPL